MFADIWEAQNGRTALTQMSRLNQDKKKLLYDESPVGSQC